MNLNVQNANSFKGIYKVTLPNVKNAANEKEKSVYTDLDLNIIVMAANNSIAKPRVGADSKSMYFKIADKNDLVFEQTFNNIVEKYNKEFNLDLAKKAYFEKVDNEEFNNAKEA